MGTSCPLQTYQEKCDGILTSQPNELHLTYYTARHAVITNKDPSLNDKQPSAHSLAFILYQARLLGVSFFFIEIGSNSVAEARRLSTFFFGMNTFQSNDFQKGDSGLPCPLVLMYLHEYWG
jgi:hypothetical protein